MYQIGEKSEYLINIIVKLKKGFLQNGYLEAEYEEERGLIIVYIKTFEKIVAKEFEQLCFKELNLLFPDLNGDFDYLFFMNNNGKFKTTKEKSIDILT